MNYSKIFKLLVIIVLVSLSHYSTYSQNANCANATPFCTGTPVTFPAGVNAGAAQPGPAYGCLGSEPNPAWFFLQMSSAGPVSISMAANSDIDFICWGPFPSLAGICSQLTAGQIQSCSYSSSNTETCTIGNAVAGAFYVLLITNYSNQNQTINFNQNNSGNSNAGTTNCGVVCGITLNNSGLVCSGGSNTLTAVTGTAINSYTLSGPGGIISTNTLSAMTNTFSSIVSGINSTTSYTLKAANNTGTCQAVSSVSVIQYPTFSVTPLNPSICQGGQLTAAVVYTGTNNQGPYNYSWSGNITSGSFATPSPGPGIFSPGMQSTAIHPSNITGTQATVVYTVSSTSSAKFCPTVHTMTLTINNPITPTLTLPSLICSTVTPVTLVATPGGGTWSANSGVSMNGIFTPSLANHTAGVDTVLYTVSVGTCNVSNTGTIGVAYFNTPALTTPSINMCVSDQSFDLMTIVQSTVGGTWSAPGGGSYVNANHFLPTGLATNTYVAVYSTTSTPYAGVCDYSSSFSVALFNPPTPTIVPLQQVCNKSATIQLVATPTIGGVWTNNGAVSSTGIFNPTVIPVGGPQTVVYTSGQGTCVASNTLNFVVSAFRTASLTGVIPDLCVTGNPFDLSTIVQDPHGTWTGGLLLPVSANYFTPTITLPTGVYTLTYNITSTPILAGCSDMSTITLSFLNPPSVNITQAGPYCNIGAPVQLTVTPATGSWVPTSYLTSGGLFTPSLSPVGNNPVHYVVGTNTCPVQATSSVSVEGFVPASIVSSIPDQCTTNSPINLSPFTLNTLGNWSGQGIVASSFNPALSGTGTITLTYNTASSPSGLCPDQSTTSVHVYSLAVPVFINVQPVCNSSPPIKLNVSPVGGIFGGANNHAVNNNGVFNPAGGIIGNNIINYSITAGPCIAYAATTISIEEFVSATISSEAGPFCKKDPTRTRNLNEFVVNPGGTWSGPATTPNGIFTFASADLNNVVRYKTHSSPTETLCPDYSDIHIKVYDTPLIEARAVKNQDCAPVKVTFNTPSVNSGFGSWNFGDGSEPGTNLTEEHIYTAPGSYTVVFNYSLMVSSDFGCVATVVVPGAIKVGELPKPDFTYSPDEIMISEPTVQFNNISASTERNKYQWTISGPEFSQTLFDVQPSVILPHVGDYKVTLLATNLDKCKSEVSKIISVKTEFNIFIPSSFSPNDDGINDLFFPVFSEYGLDEKTFEMMIFDRWGNLLYQTKDKTQKWDGKKAGQALKQDVYVYKIKYKDLTGNVYNKTGYVTIIK